MCNWPSIFEMCFVTFPARALQCNETLKTTIWFCSVGLCECEGILSDSETQSLRRYLVDDEVPHRLLTWILEPFLRTSPFWGLGLIGNNLDEQGTRSWLFLGILASLLVLLRTLEWWSVTAVEEMEEQNRFIPFMSRDQWLVSSNNFSFFFFKGQLTALWTYHCYT